MRFFYLLTYKSPNVVSLLNGYLISHIASFMIPQAVYFYEDLLLELNTSVYFV